MRLPAVSALHMRDNKSEIRPHLVAGSDSSRQMVTTEAQASDKQLVPFYKAILVFSW